MLKFIKSIDFALSGLKYMLINERNFQIQLGCFVAVCIAGFYFDISNSDWVNILIVSSLVLSLETINSAIEKTCNSITTAIKPEIKIIKDIAAAAVVITSIFALIVACLIFYKYIFNE